MKKELILFAGISLLISLPFPSEAGNSQAVSSTSARKQSSPYAIFHNVPFSQEELDISSIFPSLESADKVQQIEMSYQEENWGDDASLLLKFNEDGKLYFIEEFYFGLGGERSKYFYDEEGRLSGMQLNWSPPSQDSPMPFIKASYNYTWEGGRISEIEETLTVDNGNNYIGKPTHLQLSYNSDGKLIKAVCKENPKINFKFDSNGKMTSHSVYNIYYAEEAWDKYDYEKDLKSTDAYTDYIAKPVGLSWDYYQLTHPDANVSRYNRFQPDKNASYILDSEGNWTRARWYGPMEYDGDGYITITRSIEY